MNRLFRNPKTRIRNLILVIIPFVLLMGLFVFISIKSISNIVGNVSGDTTQSTDKKIIETMDYHLRDNATDYQVELFNELDKLIKDGTDSSAIASSVVENFVADFYTWTNKDGSYDVGGMYYVFEPSRNNVYFQARDTFYKYVTYYQKKFGKDKILEVTSVEAKGIEPKTYDLDGKSYNGYYVTCEWEYKDCSEFEVYKYEKRGYFTVVENNGRFEIIEVFGDN